MVQIIGDPVPNVITDSIDPEIGFTVTLSLDPLEALVSIEGDLISNAGMLLGPLQHRPNKELTKAINAERGWDSDQRRNRENVDFLLVARLSNPGVEHLVECRDKHERRDLWLKLRIFLTRIHSPSIVFPVSVTQSSPTAPERENLVTTPIDLRRWGSGNSNNWLISGRNSSEFLRVETQIQELEFRIPAEDWRLDFAPTLGIGKHVIAELPVAALPKSIDGELSERLGRCIESLRKMEGEFRQGEWEEVVKGARPIAELMRANDFWSVFQARLGYPADAAEEFRRIVNSIFQFTSKPLHETQHTGDLRQQISIGKEDAYLVFSVSVSLINLVLRKIAKAPEVAA